MTPPVVITTIRSTGPETLAVGSVDAGAPVGPTKKGRIRLTCETSTKPFVPEGAVPIYRGEEMVGYMQGADVAALEARLDSAQACPWLSSAGGRPSCLLGEPDGRHCGRLQYPEQACNLDEIGAGDSWRADMPG